MKKTTLISVLALSLAACNNSQPSYVVPKPGTVVAIDSMPITDDPLNHFNFTIKVMADTEVSKGVYDVITNFGPNDASSKVILPPGLEQAQPVVRKGAKPYTFIVGFKQTKDTTFYDYYEITGNHSATFMRYIKAYTH